MDLKFYIAKSIHGPLVYEGRQAALMGLSREDIAHALDIDLSDVQECQVGLAEFTTKHDLEVEALTARIDPENGKMVRDQRKLLPAVLQVAVTEWPFEYARNLEEWESNPPPLWFVDAVCQPIYMQCYRSGIGAMDFVMRSKDTSKSLRDQIETVMTPKTEIKA